MKIGGVILGFVAALVVGGGWSFYRMKTKNTEPKSTSGTRDTDGHFLDERSDATDWREWQNEYKRDD